MTGCAASIILPSRNEPGIGDLLREIVGVVDRHIRQPVEVLVIDDSDGAGNGINRTLEAVEATKRAIRSPYVVINWHHRPKGQRPGKLSGAMTEGLRLARGDVRVYMDSDGQHPPRIIPELLDAVRSGHDIVVGSRYCDGGSSEGLDGPVRHMVSRLATALVKALWPWALRGVSDPMSGCFAVRHGVIDPDSLSPRGFKFLFEVLARHPRLKRTQVPLQFRGRQDGESKAGEGNGKEFLRQVPSLRAATLPEAISFGLVGMLTAVFGAMLLWLLVNVGMKPLAANAIQLVATLAMNLEVYRRYMWPSNDSRQLRWQIPWFFASRGVSLPVSWFAFVYLFQHGWHYQVANVGGILVGFAFNYPITKFIFDSNPRRVVQDASRRLWAPVRALVVPRGRPVRHRAQRPPRRWKLKLSLAVVAALLTASTELGGLRTTLFGFIVMYSMFSFVASSMEVRWRLYGRRDPQAREEMKFPEPISAEDAKLQFFMIVAALDEPLVIGETLNTLLAQTHPNVQVVVSLSDGDHDTIRVVRDVESESGGRIHVVIRHYKKNSKPRQLNTARDWINQEVSDKGLDPDMVYVVPFDAEDDVAKGLCLHVEPLALQTGADVVQAGVQLVNLDLHTPQRVTGFRKLRNNLRGWYCVHNVMEYFFWFSSRMFYQVKLGFVPLGGNTVFIRLSMLNKIGGWPLNLTEDCAAGVKLCVEHGAKVVAAYEPRLATREETPPRMFGQGSLVRQRERWDQGFLSVLLEGEWLNLATARERLMAGYILGMPLIQAANGLMLPLALVAAFLLIGPVGLVLVMYAPFVPIVMTICLQLVGLREFAREYHQKASLRHYVSLVVGNFPFQVILSLAALSAIRRHRRGENGWRLTQHDGLHRNNTTAIAIVPIPSAEGSVA